LARGEWVQYLDADDYLLPDKIRQQMEFVAAQPELDVVFGPAIWEHWSERAVRRELVPIPEPHDHWILLASWALPQTGASLWRKQAIVDVGGWNPDQPCCQEHELYLRLLIAEKRFGYCLTNGAVYRQWSEETVCKKDISEVHRRRLRIEQCLEDHLRAINGLAPERLRAINQARFEIARGAWHYNPNLALDLMNNILRTEPGFSPTGEAAPAHYRFAFHSLGFGGAEKLAAAVRKLVSQLSSADGLKVRPNPDDDLKTRQV
jgi:hypothetical protein